MKEYCLICKTDDIPPAYAMNWKYTTFTSDNGIQVTGWICNLHFKSESLNLEPQQVKVDRKKYAKSLLQPRRGGDLSKEFIDTFGAKAANATPEEAKKAKPVWQDVLRGVDVQKTL